MFSNSIIIFSYCAGITPLEGIELDAKQAKKKDNTGCNDTFSGRHGHTITNSISEECALINEWHQ